MSNAATLDALRRCALADVLRDGAFERLTRLATRTLGVPVAFVSIVDGDRRRIVGSAGLPGGDQRVLPLLGSVCGTLIAMAKPVAVRDIAADRASAEDPLLEEAGAFAFLGVPLLTRAGFALGALSVAAREPREWTEGDAATLGDLAASVMTEIELRAAAEARTEEERRYRLAMQAARDVVWDWDLRTGIIEVNDVLATEFGHADAGRVLSYEWWEQHVHPDDLPRVRQRMEAALASGRRFLSAEYRIRRASGEWATVLDRAFVLRDESGIAVRMIGSMVNVSRSAQEGATVLRGRQAAILDTITDMAWLKDTESRFVAVNEAFAQACGMPREAVVGRTDFDLWPHQLAERYRADDAGVIARGERVVVEEMLQQPDGTTRWIETVKVPFRDERGNVAGTVGTARDVTARKQVELERERALATLLSNLPAMAYRRRDDERWTLEYASEGAAMLTRRDPASLTGHGGAYHALVHPDDRKPTETRIREAMREGTPFEISYRLVVGADDVRWVVDRGRRVGADADGVAIIEGIVTDITEQRRATERMRATHELLRAVIDDSPLAIVAVDLDLTVTRWSREAERLFGWRADEVVGARYPLVPTDGEQESRAMYEAAVSGRPPLGLETRRQRKDGTLVDVRISLGALRDDAGAVIGVVGVLEDIGEQRRTRAQLHDEQARLQLVLEAAGMATWEWDIASDRARWTSSMKAPVEALGDDHTLSEFLRAVHPDDQAAVAMAVAEAVQGATAYDVEFRIVVPGQPVRWVNSKGHVARDPDGQPRRLIGVSIDITKHKRLEEELRQSQKMEAIGQLAGGIAHDFNNLLTIIKAHTEFLLADLGEHHKSRDDAREIGVAATRAAALTRQLLAFSRRQMLQPRVLDLNAVVTEAERMLVRLIGEDIRIVKNLDPALGQVLADPGQLEQVLVNLAVNARDAMPDGGTLLIETRNVAVDEQLAQNLGAMQPGPYVLLAVGDTGVGMDAETQARVFEPFFTTKVAGKGTGLGLSTVYGIVKQSEGYVWVYSEPGRGTTFKIYLPLAATEKRPAVPEAAVAATPAGNETILLVEDESAVRRVAKRVLERQGYRILEAVNGRDGLRVAKAHAGPIDLLVTDAVMPEMGGPELAREIARVRPATRILLVSGYADDLRRGPLDPGVAFLEKPYTAQLLAAAVRDALDAPRVR